MFKPSFLVCSLFIALTPPSAAEAAKWAILIGPTQYEDSANLRPLKFAGTDVKRLAEVLVSTGHEADHVIVMTDDAAEESLRPTREAIHQQIQSVLSHIGEQNTESLMVVFAGHGVNIQGHSYLCPSDGRLHDPNRTLLPLSTLSTLLARSQASQKFLIVDACREEIGQAGQTEFNLLTGLNAMKLNDNGSQGLVYFASCLARQRSIEDKDNGYGLFLNSFAEALGGNADVQSAGNHDGFVSCHEAFQYASDKTRQRSRELTGWEQQPWYEGRATAGLSLTKLSEERQRELEQLALEEPRSLSGKVQHSQLLLTEALYALQEGNIEQVLSKSLESIELDPSNRMAYRTAAMAYQFKGEHSEAILTMAKIKEPLRIKATSSSLTVLDETRTVATVQPGDTIEVTEVQETPDGNKWARVTAIRLGDSGDKTEVSGYVSIQTLKNQPVAPKDLLADFSRQNQQPPQLAASWGSGTSGIDRALDTYDKIQRIPYVPSVPSIPYVGGVRGLLGR